MHNATQRMDKPVDKLMQNTVHSKAARQVLHEPIQSLTTLYAQQKINNNHYFLNKKNDFFVCTTQHFSQHLATSQLPCSLTQPPTKG